MEGRPATDEYFSSLNSICRSIIKEKVSFASLLGDQWESLPEEEQDALLDEHFVAPHIRQKYAVQSDAEDLPEFYPVLKVKSGQRIVEDDEGEKWQDEHSGPFSWETSSQSELSFDTDDILSTDNVKLRAKDPKRPKSPRLMRAGSGEQLAPRPGALERAGSSDFHQLRHIWETHHSVTPDGDPTSGLNSFLSKSQSSLNGDQLAFSKKMSASVDSIAESEDEEESKNDRETTPDLGKETSVTIDTEIAAANEKQARDIDIATSASDLDMTDTKRAEKPTVANAKQTRVDASATGKDTPAPAVSTTKGAAPLATREDDEDISTNMKADIARMSEIQHKMAETLAADDAANQHPTTVKSANQRSVPAKSTNGSSAARKPEEVDILAKFGVTFGTGTEDSAEVNEEDEAADLPSGFDFLSSW